jgi:hypothetical protein
VTMSVLHRQNTHVPVLPKRKKSKFAGKLAIMPTDGASTKIDQYLFFLKLITIKSDESFKITIERSPEQRLKALWQKSVLKINQKSINLTEFGINTL